MTRGASLRLARVAGAVVVAGVFLAAVVPASVHLGAYSEEVVGLVHRLPRRVFPGHPPPPDPEHGPRLVSTPRLPVWSVVWPGGRVWPLMADGHIGALEYYPARLAEAAGGLLAARLSVGVLGLVTLLGLFLLGRRILGEAAGWAAVALAASSAHFHFPFVWCRAEEVWSFLGYVLALVLYLRFLDTRRTRWLLLAAAAAGLGVAAKTTGVWNLFALAGAALWLRAWPRLTRRQWVAAGAVFLLPLVPQVLYLLLGDVPVPFRQRLAMVPWPWQALAPGRLAFFARDFVHSFGATGSYLGGYIDARPTGRLLHLSSLAGGAVALGAVAVLAGLALRRRTPRPLRLLGLAFGLLCLEYVAFYYEGMTLFTLLTPWVPLILGVTGVWAWRLAAPWRARRLVRGGLVGVAIALVGVQTAQTVRFARAVRHPAYGMFDLATERSVTAELVSLGATRPVTTTYGIVGVLDVLSDGAVRPEHVFPLFEAALHAHQRHQGTVALYRRVWDRVLGRLGPGVHYLLLSPHASILDTNPVADMPRVVAALAPAVAARAGRLEPVRAWDLQGHEVFRLVRVTLPAAAADW